MVDTCGAREDPVAEVTTIGPHKCETNVEGEPKLDPKHPEIEVIDARNKKIVNVQAKVDRQTAHINAILRSKKKNLKLIDRWVGQNKKAIAKLNELDISEETPDAG